MHYVRSSYLPFKMHYLRSSLHVLVYSPTDEQPRPSFKNKSKNRVAAISAKKHKRQRRKRQSVTAKREKSQAPKVLNAILTLPNLT